MPRAHPMPRDRQRFRLSHPRTPRLNACAALRAIRSSPLRGKRRSGPTAQERQQRLSAEQEQLAAAVRASEQLVRAHSTACYGLWAKEVAASCALAAWHVDAASVLQTRSSRQRGTLHMQEGKGAARCVRAGRAQRYA